MLLGLYYQPVNSLSVVVIEARSFEEMNFYGKKTSYWNLNTMTLIYSKKSLQHCSLLFAASFEDAENGRPFSHSEGDYDLDWAIQGLINKVEVTV